MSAKMKAVVASTIGIDTAKNTLHLIGPDDQGTIVCVRIFVPAGLKAGWRRQRRIRDARVVIEAISTGEAHFPGLGKTGANRQSEQKQKSTRTHATSLLRILSRIGAAPG